MEERNNMCYGVDMSKEEWRTKPEWKGYYEFSNWGRCRSVDRVINYSNGRQRYYPSKLRKINDDGSIILQIQGIRYNEDMKNVIAELFIPQYRQGMPLSFKDVNTNNYRLDNIVLGIWNDIGDTKMIPYDIHNIDLSINDVPVIEGGFGQGTKVLFDITLAEKAHKFLGNLRKDNIIPNLNNMTEGVDYINLMDYNFNQYIPLLMDLGYTMNSFTKSSNIFIFSERGVSKVMSSLQNTNPAKWQFLNNFVNEYFNMREQIQNQVPQLTEKQSCILALYEGGAEAVIAGKRLSELEVQEATAPLLDTIEKQAPKVDKFERYMESDGTYNATNTAKLLNISSAQKFNNLLKDEKIQYRSGKNWVLYSKYQWLIDEGYCKYIEGENSNYSYIQLRWFPKGVDWLRTQLQEQVI